MSAVYRPAPGEPPGELGPNGFTAGSLLRLNCLVHGNSSELSYRWSVSGNPSTPGCRGCDIDLSSTTSTLTVGKPPLYSYYAGVYRCTASEAGRYDSGNIDDFNVTVVGKHASLHTTKNIPFIYSGASLYKDRGGSGPINNNGLIISANDGLVFDCVSNSSQSGVGTITAPDNVDPSGHVVIYAFNRPGLVRLRTQTSLTTDLKNLTLLPFAVSDQGIYTCTIPDSNGYNISLNVGLYPPGFNGEHTSPVIVGYLSLPTQRVPSSHI